MLGEDFKRARSAWLYPQGTLQTFWRALAIALLLLVLSLILEGIFVLPYYRFAFGGDLAGLRDANALTSPSFLAADLMAKFPASLLVAALALYFAKFGLPKGMGHLPLAVPKIGPFGWVLLVGGFVLISSALAMLVFVAMGVDQAAFQGGPVEKEIADLVKNPILFALIMPGVILGAPLIEEFIFRGALFAGLVQSPVGKPGAVIISAGVVLWPVLLTALGRNDSLSGRTVIWGFVARSIAKRPLLGYGFYSFWLGMKGESARLIVGTNWTFGYAHNGVLEIWLQLGLVGVVMFFITLLQATRDAWFCLRRDCTPGVQWYIGLIVLTMLYNVDESTVFWPIDLLTILYLVACAGLATTARQIRQREALEAMYT